MHPRRIQKRQALLSPSQEDERHAAGRLQQGRGELLPRHDVQRQGQPLAAAIACSWSRHPALQLTSAARPHAQFHADFPLVNSSNAVVTASGGVLPAAVKGW
jgi:hypothetical protein